MTMSATQVVTEHQVRLGRTAGSVGAGGAGSVARGRVT